MMRTTLLLACASVGIGACAAGPASRCPKPVRPSVAADLPANVDPVAKKAVLELQSEDFSTRNRASEALLAMGEDALPALIAAGDRRATAHGKVSVSVTRPVLEAVLEKSSDATLESRHLPSPSPFVRKAAARELGRRLRLEAVPALADRLDDDDADVRAAVKGALEKITERFERAKDLGASAAAWRGWWAREGRAAADKAPPR